MPRRSASWPAASGRSPGDIGRATPAFQEVACASHDCAPGGKIILVTIKREALDLNPRPRFTQIGRKVQRRANRNRFVPTRVHQQEGQIPVDKAVFDVAAARHQHSRADRALRRDCGVQGDACPAGIAPQRHAIRR